MADEEEAGNWTIKSVLPQTRKLALACAGKRGETMSIWISRAVATQANLEAGDRVTPPSERVANPEPQEANLPPMRANVTELADLLRAVTEAAKTPELSAGVKRQAAAVLTDALRAARGLPPKAPRPPQPRVLRIANKPEDNPSP